MFIEKIVHGAKIDFISMKLAVIGDGSLGTLTLKGKEKIQLQNISVKAVFPLNR